MRDFFKTTRFKIIIGVLSALVVVMIISAAVGGNGSGVLNVVVSPFQRLSTWITNATTDLFTDVANSGKNAEENKKLKEEIASLREQLVDYHSTKDENEQLKEMMGLKNANSNYQYEAATVIGRDADDRYGSFQIDKGSLNGIQLHDPIITRDGLVGYISEVGLTSSRVATILSTDINVGACGVYSGETGVVTGEPLYAEKGQCKLKYLLRESAIAKSELITTTGLSGIFPKGLVIGTVEKLIPESGGTSVCAIIEPSVQIEEVKNVFVITEFTGKGDDEATDSTSSEDKSTTSSAKEESSK